MLRGVHSFTMVHVVGDGFDAAIRFCKAHNGPRDACVWLHRAKGAATVGLTAAALGGWAGGREGSQWGLVLGVIVGAAYPEISEAIQRAGLDEAMHG